MQEQPDEVGELRRKPVVQLLWELVSRRFSGTLTLETDADGGVLQGESRFAFVEGRLSQARLAQPLDTLGAVLHEQGRIDSAQLDASLLRLARHEGLQGELLVAMGACTHTVVEAAIREQLARKLVRLFALAHGRWGIYERRDLLLDFGAERFPIHVTPLLWVGVRANPRNPAVDEVMRRLGDQHVRLRDPAAATLFGGSAEERAIVDALTRGSRPDALAAAGHPMLLARSAVYFLAMTRLLERYAAPASAATAMPPSPPSSPTALPQRPSQPGVPAVRPSQTDVSPVRPSQTAVAAVRPSLPDGPLVRPSQFEVPAVSALHVEDSGQRISTSNLPAVKGDAVSVMVHATQSAAANTSDARARLAEAESVLALLEMQTAFEMLGVAQDAPPVTVTAAFRSIAPRWHPETVSPHLTALRERCARIFALLSEAEATLSRPETRARHLQEIAAGVATPKARRALANRQVNLARAESALRQHGYAEAERLARQVLDESVGDLEATLVLAGALVLGRPTGPFDEARRLLAKVLEKQPENDRAQVLMAQMFRRQGDERKALLAYVKAYKLNARNVDAVRELRLAVMRKRDAGAGQEDNEMRAAIARLLGIKT